MCTDANVAQVLLADAFKQRPHAGLMHLATQKVCLWHHTCNVGCGFTHAKANFEDDRANIDILLASGPFSICVSRYEINSFRLVGEQEFWAEFLKGLDLAGGGAPSAAHKTLDLFRVGHALWPAAPDAECTNGVCG